MIEKLKKSFLMVKKRSHELEFRTQHHEEEQPENESGSDEIVEEEFDDPLIKERKDQFEEACKNCESELEIVSQEILKK